MAAKHELIFDDGKLQLFFQIVGPFEYFTPSHWHEHLEIIYMLDGSMLATVGNSNYKMKPKDLLVVNSKDIHSTTTLTKVSYILMQIPFTFLHRALDCAPFLRFDEFYPAELTEMPALHLRKCMENMRSIYLSKSDGFRLDFMAQLYTFLSLLFQNHSTLLSVSSKAKETRDLNRMEEIFDYINENYTRSVPLEEAAGLLSLSPEYFCRLFKKHTGQTFLEYVNTVRMVHFYNDLLHTDDTVTFLMSKHGITNYKAFIKIFKKAYHTTPKKLRLSLRE